MSEKEAPDEQWGAGVGAKLQARTCQIQAPRRNPTATLPGAMDGAGPGVRTKKPPTRISSHFHLLDMKRFDNHAHNTFLHRVTCPNKYHLRPNNLSFLRMRTVTENLTLPNLGFSLLPRSDFTEPQYQPTESL